MKNHWKLFLISLLGLYLELCFIRWVSSEIRIFAYAKNLVLLACYLGFGLGTFMARRRSLLPLSLGLTAGLVVVTNWPGDPFRIRAVAEALSQFNDLQIMGQAGQTVAPGEAWLQGLFGLTWVVLVFLTLMVLFIPYGQLLGRYVTAHGNNIRAYSINIAGSIVGIWAYTALSLVQLPPLIWLVLGMSLALLFLERWGQRAVAVGCIALTAVFLWPNWGTEIWSSYQKLQIVRTGDIEAIVANNTGHMTLEPMAAPDPDDPTSINRWNMPYYFHPRPEDVLIVGAGAGNDISVALAAGAQHVVAVEIDPSIYRLGQARHPDHPYDDPRVEVVIDDARHYFSTADRSFDLIIFSHLDSLTVLSGFTNVRLDNYIYTVESLQQARALLKDQGLIYLTYWANSPWVRNRLYNNLAVAMGHAPFFIDAYDEVAGSTVELVHFLAAEAPAQREIEARYPGNWPGFWVQALPANDTPILTDDWPFLYVERHAIPTLVLILMGTVSAFAILFVWVAFRQLGRGRFRLHWHFFFLGAAFLLVETHNVGKLALIFGTTWIVNSWVISAILVLILLANLCVERFRVPVYAVYGGLGISLLLGYLIPAGLFIPLPGVLKVLGSVALYTLPVFFAGIIFSQSFARSAAPDQDLGSNMLGAILGGVLENLSLAWGIRSLFLVALVLYLLSLAALPGIRGALRRAVRAQDAAAGDGPTRTIVR